jgi:hypothetical protein
MSHGGFCVYAKMHGMVARVRPEVVLDAELKLHLRATGEAAQKVSER